MKLTHKEHDARAMLLGRVYDWRDGTYCLPSESGTGGVITRDMLDAVTLEPITQTAAFNRAQEWANFKSEDGPWSTKLAFENRPETPIALGEGYNEEV